MVHQEELIPLHLHPPPLGGRYPLPGAVHAAPAAAHAAPDHFPWSEAILYALSAVALMELAVVLVELVVVLVIYLDEADVVEIWYVLFVAVLEAPVDALVVYLDLADAVEILFSLSEASQVELTSQRRRQVAVLAEVHRASPAAEVPEAPVYLETCSYLLRDQEEEEDHPEVASAFLHPAVACQHLVVLVQEVALSANLDHCTPDRHCRPPPARWEPETAHPAGSNPKAPRTNISSTE